MPESVRAGTVEQLRGGARALVTLNGREVVVFHHHGDFHAFSNVCLHQGGPVGEGMLIGKVESRIDSGGCWLGDRFSDDEIHIVCPWHGWEYDIRTGEMAGDRRLRLRRYDTRVEGEDVYVIG
ncbi:MAG TPA: Rieske 2Fe-2S domain-containing protein [Candidatus Micrarchaeaceae archaeon]|nr:Rieske 2Fe-2S domain-containing protein [Candidatus Micrarchaeaceae archaeon]